jgi:pimeloyl-ACP methyl ester carboxylesterase
MPHVTSADGTRIAYTATGTGPALIYVMGATAYRAVDQLGGPLAAALGDRVPLITYDRRGRGESTDTLPYAVEREIEDIAALIDAAGGRASLLGLSSGAVLATEAAATGLPVDKLALYEPPFVTDPTVFPPPPADYIATLDAFTARGDKGGAVAYFMSTVGVPPEQIEGMRASPFWPMMEPIGPTIAYDGRVMFGAYYTEHRFPERWQRITQPTLVIHGDASFPFIPGAAAAVTAALPNATTRVLPGQGHGPAADAIAPVLREFLAT